MSEPTADTLADRLARLIEVLGPHPVTRLGLDVTARRDRERWLAAARLASARGPEERALEAFRRLDAATGTSASDLAAAGPERIAAAVAGAGLRDPDAVAIGLWRAAAALEERHGGDLDALAGECLDWEDLGGRLVALAPGLGPATVLRFLRPLRDVWSAARETPLAETARAAAVHLSLIDARADLEGEPAALRAACAARAPDLAAIDVEGALERLGVRSCRAGRPDRCPLGEACPARGAADDESGYS